MTEDLGPGEAPNVDIVRTQVQKRIDDLRRRIRRLEPLHPEGDELAELLGWKASLQLWKDVAKVMDAYAFSHKLFEPMAKMVLERVGLMEYRGKDVLDRIKALHERTILWLENVSKIKFKERRARGRSKATGS